MPDEISEHDALARTVRTEGARILATLVRTVGDLQVAEDAVQEAAIRALRDWPRNGLPAQPRAWLTVAARHAAIDIVRRERARPGKERESVDLGALERAWEPPPEGDVRDDRLRLIFTCCHPALGLDAQVTLALRVLCGLSTEQIAAVLLTSDAAVAKRLTRTRAKISRAAIPYRVPSAQQLPARLAAVSAVVHTFYTSAYSAAAPDEVNDVDACAEAVRLARLVHDLLPDEPAPMAVLALLLLTEARRGARIDDDGVAVPLAEQDRSRWDRGAVDEGRALAAESLRRTAGIADPYQLQAAIALEHDTASSYASTDWAEIVRLYDLVLTVRPSAPAALARAVALAESQGTAAGLAALDPLVRDSRWHAVRADLLARAGRFDEAVDESEESLRAEVGGPERRYRQRRIRQWSGDS